MKRYNVGILGATGMVGQRFVSLLENHPWFRVTALAASERSAGKTYSEAVGTRWIMESPIPIALENETVLDAVRDIRKIVSIVDFVFCAVDMKSDEIRKLEEDYAKLECPVISNNSAHRRTPDVPMVIPEVNPEHIKIIESQRRRLGTNRGFIAVKSNCSLQCYVPAAHPLFDFGIRKILICTYQAISGAGKTFDRWPQMRDNIIPFIPGEEEKSECEPLKIWGKIKNDKIVPASLPKITSQCIRVPVSDGHTAAVFMSFDQKVDTEEIIRRWDSYKAYSQTLGLPSSPGKFLYYFRENDRPQIGIDRNIEDGMAISIGRLRKDNQYDIKFACASHNTIRGAAGGAVLMAELLCREKYIK